MNKFNKKLAGLVGSVVGSCSSLVLVSKAGIVSGLGATGITSGLGSVGGAIGGGMATGLGVVATAPILIGCLSYVGYKYFVDDK
ncbi:hypothetical protein [Kangiella sp.]|uniref:hypothetical protein n=1 Tax=Kangiella sp. TaxID=1920245 RepID=UPI003A922EC8